MNRNVKKAECSAKSFFLVCMLLKLKKINFITVKDQLYICYKDEKGHWSKSINIEFLNTDNSDWCPTVSPDEKYLFFTRNNTGNGDIYWVDANIIEELKPEELK